MFENGRTLPRIFAPPVAAAASAEEESAGPADFAGRVVVSGAGRPSVSLSAAEPNPPVTFEKYAERTNEASFHYSLGGIAPSVAVASLVNDGGWSATTEGGRAIPTLRADGPFLGLILPPGRHFVRLSYRPPGFRLGAAVSAATALVLLAGVAFLRRGRPRRS